MVRGADLLGRCAAHALRNAVLALLALLSGGGVALAHPHVWIENVLSVEFAQGRISRLVLDWRFDEFYSALVGSDFDKDRNGKLDEEELAHLARQSEDAMRAAGYFLHIRAGGKPVPVQRLESLTASVDGRRIRYRLAVGFTPPFDPRNTPISIGIYDASYYVDVALERDDPVRLTGEGSTACHFALVPDAANPIYFGMVTPTVVQIMCRTE